MRKDMAKVIVERPRWGRSTAVAWRAPKLRADEDAWEDAPVPMKIGARRAALLTGHRKALNENLAPLRRYLERQAGRRWDDVWSEICANLRVTSTVQQHVRDHVPDFVALKVRGEGEAMEVWRGPRLGWWMPIAQSRVRVYVDGDGIVRKNPFLEGRHAHRRRKKKVAAEEARKRRRIVGPYRQLHRFEGLGWWEVELAPVPRRTRHEWNAAQGRIVSPLPGGVIDVVQDARLSPLGRHALYGTDGVYAVAKRQLSAREMMKRNLPRD